MKHELALDGEAIELYRKLKPQIDLLETQRKHVLNELFFYIPVISGVTVIVTHKLLSLSLTITGICFVTVIALIYFWKTLGYTKKFKEQIVAEIFKTLAPGSYYLPEQYVSQSLFTTSDLYSNFNRYGGEDFASGKIHNIDFEFSELCVKYVSGSGKNKTTKIVFNGLFWTFSLPRTLGQRTLILNDVAESTLGSLVGRFIQKKLRPGYELVQVESAEFEKKFVVYSNDQIKSRYLLNPIVMEDLCEFRKKYRESIDVSLQDDKLFIGVKTNKNYFEPRIWNKVVSYQDIQEICDILKLAKDIINSLDIKSKLKVL